MFIVRFDNRQFTIPYAAIKASMAQVTCAKMAPGWSGNGLSWEGEAYPDLSWLKVGGCSNPGFTGTFAKCEGQPYIPDPRQGAVADPSIAELVLRHAAGLLSNEQLQAAVQRRETLAAQLEPWRRTSSQDEVAARKLLAAAKVTYFRYVAGPAPRRYQTEELVVEGKPGMPGFEIRWPGCDFRIRVLLLGPEKENQFCPGVIPGMYADLADSCRVEVADLGEKDFPPIPCQLEDCGPIGYIKAGINWHKRQKILLQASIC